MSKGMITSRGTVTQGSIMFRKTEKENKKMGVNVEHNTKHTYEYDGKCVRMWKRRGMRIMFRYTCAGIRIMMMQIKKGDRHRSRVVRTSRAP